MQAGETFHVERAARAGPETHLWGGLVGSTAELVTEEWREVMLGKRVTVRARCLYAVDDRRGSICGWGGLWYPNFIEGDGS